MNMSVGPFSLIFVLIMLFVLYASALYLIIKNRLGIIAVLIVFLFPFLGSVSVIVYSALSGKKKEVLK
ncbi:hypothetical protein [uncultured Chryseobacterium sp.]|jgi:hypothetical protein|uniref:hypothetical protein n=1 Tax=uncultured Chryseobacterium sp. TaxID=259322 RepID=UPI002613BBAD|nr:hypothetical protein [uncultured Chryseobacterium sp.]